MMMEMCHSSTKAEICDNENTAIVTNQQVLKLWKEDEQLCCHPIHNWDVPRKSEKERTNEKREWKTVDNCSENRTWPDVKLLLYFFLFSFLPFLKNWNTPPVMTVCLQHYHYHHFTVLINPTFGKIIFFI